MQFHKFDLNLQIRVFFDLYGKTTDFPPDLKS